MLCIELEQSERRESRLRDEARSLQEQVLHLKAERGVLADQLAASKSTAGRNQDAAAKVLGSLKVTASLALFNRAFCECVILYVGSQWFVLPCFGYLPLPPSNTLM